MKRTGFLRSCSDEEGCKAAREQCRDRVDVTHPYCGCKEHCRKADKECRGCRKCGCIRSSLEAGIVTHGFWLPFRCWLMAMQTLASARKSFSAKGLRRQPGHKSCNPVRATLHKPCNAIGRRNPQYGLNGTAGLDEGFFATEIHGETNVKPLKRVQDGQRKTTATTMAETAPGNGGNPKRGHKPKAVRRIRTLAANSFKATDIETEVRANSDLASVAISDDSTSYTDFKSVVKKLHARVMPKGRFRKALTRVRIAISDAERSPPDVFHGIVSGYLWNCPDGFCRKSNRRHFCEILFDRLAVAGVSCKNELRYNIG